MNEIENLMIQYQLKGYEYNRLNMNQVYIPFRYLYLM